VVAISCSKMFPCRQRRCLAEPFAKYLGCQFKRVQCTPICLLGCDGNVIFNQKTRRFRFRPGPVFTQILLAEWINRATPRTRIVGFEAMAEARVKPLNGKNLQVEPPFPGHADRQNPVDSRGTFPLPEASTRPFS